MIFMYVDMNNCCWCEIYVISLNLAFFSYFIVFRVILCYLCVIIFLCVNS